MNKILALFFDKLKLKSPKLYMAVICLLISGKGVIEYLQSQSIIDGQMWESIYGTIAFVIASVLGTRTTSYLK
jgi:hypothetical protein